MLVQVVDVFHRTCGLKPRRRKPKSRRLPMQPPTNSQTRRYSVKELQRVLFSKLLTRPTPNEHKCLEKHRYSGFETWYTRFRLDINLRQRLLGQKLSNLDAEYTNGKPQAAFATAENQTKPQKYVLCHLNHCYKYGMMAQG
jgi:hypothetical protein